jgi:hypothetical protein
MRIYAYCHSTTDGLGSLAPENRRAQRGCELNEGCARSMIDLEDLTKPLRGQSDFAPPEATYVLREGAKDPIAGTESSR